MKSESTEKQVQETNQVAGIIVDLGLASGPELAEVAERMYAEYLERLRTK